MSWLQLKSIALNDGAGPPTLWPDTASADYTAARLQLAKAEAALRDQTKAVAAMRRELPPGPTLPAYTFAEGPKDLAEDAPERPVTLRDLFGDHESLVVYHLMFHPDDDESCPMCALWVDGLHGAAHHLTRRTAFAVIGKASLGKLRRWALRRGWDGLRIVSSHDNTFNTDMNVESPTGGQWPAVSVFTRDGDTVRHVLTQSAEFPDGSANGIDLLSPVWHLFDLLPQGRGDWLPDNAYPGRDRG